MSSEFKKCGEKTCNVKMPKGLNKYHSYQCRDKAKRRREKSKKKESPGHWRKLADTAASKYYRAKTPYCEAAGKDHQYKKGGFPCTYQLQWCHVYRRGYQGIRYEEYNHLIMCSAHHAYFTHYPEEWALFMQTNYPSRWKMASDNRNSYCNATTDHYKKWLAKFSGSAIIDK